jgi:hypothetical protein
MNPSLSPILHAAARAIISLVVIFTASLIVMLAAAFLMQAYFSIRISTEKWVLAWSICFALFTYATRRYWNPPEKKTSADESL